MLNIDFTAVYKAVIARNLESAIYFKVEYPIREFLFGYLRGGIPPEEWPDYILNSKKIRGCNYSVETRWETSANADSDLKDWVRKKIREQNQRYWRSAVYKIL